MSGRNPIRVAMVIDTVGPWSVGGRERRYEELLRRLPTLGLDVTVYTMHWWSERPGDQDNLRFRAITPRLRLYKKDRRSIVQGLVFALGTFQLIARRFDVIQADHMPYLQLLPLRVIAWLHRVHLIVDWHEYWGPSYWRTYMGRAGSVGAILEAASLRLPDGIVAVTDELREKLIAAGASPSRVKVIPNAVDRQGIEGVAPDSAAPDLLFIGRLVPHKRGDVAIRAVAALAVQGVATSLGLIGDGPERTALADLAVTLDVESRVRFYGSFEAQRDVWSLLKGAHVLIFPSEREGFGLVVAESLAAGTPVVCIKGPDTEAYQLVADKVTGSVISGPDPLAIAQAARSWLARRADRRQIAHEFWSAHADLDWDTSATHYANLLRGES